ncbi:MAG: dihydrofolate reductase [Oscillospiraceae bacterium]|nr:dihydrofolate reductase [Oscillospiraceae bacterium]
MKAIVAVSRNLGIGYENDLLYNIPEDKKFFRSMTLGKVVVMGRKTLESMPGGKPLKDRTNIVLTRNPDYAPQGVTVCHSEEELLTHLNRYKSDDVMIIGGAEIYRQLLPHCDTAYVTKINDEKPADKFFPDLDSDKEWTLAESSEEKDYEGIGYRFCTYRRA